MIADLRYYKKGALAMLVFSPDSIPADIYGPRNNDGSNT